MGLQKEITIEKPEDVCKSKFFKKRKYVGKKFKFMIINPLQQNNNNGNKYVEGIVLAFYNYGNFESWTIKTEDGDVLHLSNSDSKIISKNILM